jgi:hypothetical protein
MIGDLGPPGITWLERMQNLTRARGRMPTLSELIDVMTIHTLIDADARDRDRREQENGHRGRPNNWRSTK